MSWADLLGDQDPEVRPSPSESARFGLTVDRLMVGDRAIASDATVAALAARSTADVLVLRYPARRIGLFASLLGPDRDVVLADQLCYWRLQVGHGRAPAPIAGVDVVNEAPEGLVGALVGEIFAGYGNHYLADPVLDPEAALAGYQEWAGRTAASEGVCVLRSEGEPVGLATMTYQDGALEIELAGVLAAHQGRGLYAHLLAAVERRAISLGADDVVISTQAHNAGVQRAWARQGFEPVVAFTTVHLVRAGLVRAGLLARS